MFKSDRQEGGDNSSSSDIDWEAYNKHIVESAQLEEPETLVGYISMIVELGKQEQEDAKVKFDGTPEDEARILAEEAEKYGDKGTTYFDDVKDFANGGVVTRMKRWKNKPAYAIAIAVDFPEILVNKGQFFSDGDGEMLPLRMWLGGKFKGKMGFSINLKEQMKDFGSWSLGKKHTLHKMAVAAKLTKADEPFPASRLEELLGQSLQFNARVFMNGEWLNEKIKFVGGLGRGQVPAKIASETHCVYFDQESASEDAWKGVSNHVKNTIKDSTEYEGSYAKMKIEGNATQAEEASAVPAGNVEDESDLPF